MDNERRAALIAKLKIDKNNALARRQIEENEKKIRRKDAQKRRRKNRLAKIRQEKKASEEKQSKSECHKSAVVDTYVTSSQKTCKSSVRTETSTKRSRKLPTKRRLELDNLPDVIADLEPGTGKRRKLNTQKAPPAISRKDHKIKWKQYSQRYRDKMKNDPTLAEKQKVKEHERYLRRKEAKKIKLVGELSARAKRKQRQKWRENTRKYRLTRKLNQECDDSVVHDTTPATCAPPQTPAGPNIPNTFHTEQLSAAAKRGRRQVRRDRAMAYSRLREVEQKLAAANRKSEKYRKRLQRLQSSCSNSPTPRKKVKAFLKGRNVGKDIRSRLVMAECLNKQLKFNAKQATGHKQKYLFTRAVSGHILKKYRLLSKLKSFCPYWRYSRANTVQERGTLRKERMSHVRSREHAEVIAFLENDANSVACPGKKDFLVKGGQKQQKRFLRDTLGNLHVKFCQLHAKEMSYSKFCLLKPFWIVQPQVSDRQTCLCVRHENIKLLIRKMHQVGLITEKDPNEVCKAVVCDVTSKKCMYGECELCQDKVLPETKNETPQDVNLFYNRWVTKTEQRRRATDGVEIKVKVTSKVKVEATSADMISTLQEELPDFEQHHYRAYHQQAQLTALKAKLNCNECVLVIDYSENYLCKYGSETQSVHFGASRRQLTLHTAVLYYRNGANELNCKSFCTISESLRHDPSAVWAHLKPVLNYMRETIPALDTLHVWSDGPTTQYRNRRNFGLFSQIEFFGFTAATWNFTESGHGKGAADGIGGSIKRAADRLVARGNDITDADSLYKLLLGITSTRLSLVTEENIKEIDQEFDTSKIKAVKGTMKLHQLTWERSRSSQLGLRYLTCLECNSDCPHYGVGEVTMDVTCNRSRKCGVSGKSKSSSQDTRAKDGTAPSKSQNCKLSVLSRRGGRKKSKSSPDSHASSTKSRRSVLTRPGQVTEQPPLPRLKKKSLAG